MRAPSRDPETPEDVVASDYWVRNTRKKFDRLIKENAFAGIEDRTLEQKLRTDTLVGFARLQAASIDEAHPDFLLRVLKETARITGLTGPDVNVNISGGTAESLPDLSGYSDEQIAALARGEPLAIETTATPVEEKPSGNRKAKRRKPAG